jgi:pimeloyl-ACP methyl ester carboxylesterase
MIAGLAVACKSDRVEPLGEAPASSPVQEQRWADQKTRPEVSQVKLDGAELTVRDVGSGPPVLFIHGAILLDALAPLMKEPAIGGAFRVVSYGRRGFGRKPTPPISLKAQAADAAAVLDHVAIERAHVVGHSLGAAIALQMAHDFPDRVQTLTLIEPPLPAHVPSGAAFAGDFQPVVAAYQKGDKAGAMAMFLTWVGGPDVRSVIDGKLPAGAWDLGVADIDTFFQVELPSTREWKFGAEQGQTLKMPLLVACGAETNALFKESCEVLAKWAPQTQQHEIAGANHMAPATHSKEVAESLTQFWRQAK